MSIENGCDYYFSCKDCECPHCLVVKQRKEIERLKAENCHDYHCMCLAQQEKAELQKQVDELTEKLGKVLLGIKADEVLIAKGVEQAVKDTAPLAIQRFINQLYIDRIMTDNDLENEMLKVKRFVLKRYYGVEVE